MAFKTGQLSKLLVTRSNPSSFENAARTTLAAVASYLMARLFHMPESYWAAISTIVVMQSSVSASLPVSVQRFAGTAMGSVVGAVTASFFPGNLWAFGAAVLAIGLLCATLHIERSAYRYAGITLAIVMLVPRSSNVWLTAIDRYCEVSLGIAMGLIVSGLWPER